MEVKLEKRYPLAASPAQAWLVLRDVNAVAGCMPGAAITEQLDATHYKGAVKVKVGPATAAFSGDIEILALDEAAHHMQLLGKGADKSGSTASMNLSARVEPGDKPEQSVLVGDAVVIVNGKFAQFGGRMMVQVSDMILLQFAGNFSLAAAAMPVAQAPTTVDDVPAAPATSANQPVHKAAAAAEAAPGSAPALAALPANPPPPTAPVRPQAQTELNGLAIVWALIKGWFGGLFAKRG
jgi:carbon monoxide dehydrogenase subunit G